MEMRSLEHTANNTDVFVADVLLHCYAIHFAQCWTPSKVDGMQPELLTPPSQLLRCTFTLHRSTADCLPASRKEVQAPVIQELLLPPPK